MPTDIETAACILNQSQEQAAREFIARFSDSFRRKYAV